MVRSVRPKDRFLVFGAPAIEEAEIEEVIATLKSGWLGTGPRVARFEGAFRNYKGAEFAVGVSSCTAALHLSLLVAGVKTGDEVITSAMTFCATVNAIIHAGGTPVLVDIDPTTMNMDPVEVEAKITARTRAILPVHFAGRPCDMDRLCSIAERYELKLIEDCAHAIETEYKGRKAGTFGDFGCFSFYVTKNVTTAEGGMVLASYEDDAARIKRLSLHGMGRDAWSRFSSGGYRHYEVVECGFKYNMTDIQAAIGIHQLARVEKAWIRRREIWNRYQDAFGGLPITLPADPEPQTRHAYHLYAIFVDEDHTGLSRDRFLQMLTGHNIGAGVHYLSLPEHPYYQHAFGWMPEHYPNAMRLGRQTLSLPLTVGLSDGDVGDVIEAVSRIIERRGL